jgi:uncharacterized protein (DUF2141 family)
MNTSNNEKFKPLKSLPTALAGLISALAMNTHAGELTIHLHGIQVNSGNVMVALYNSSASFMKGATRSLMVPVDTNAQSSSVTIMLKNLEPGRYAISAFHDVNSNGKLDSNAFRIPSEPVGFSNRAAPRFGPPTFEEAAFDFGHEPSIMTIDLK